MIETILKILPSNKKNKKYMALIKNDKNNFRYEHFGDLRYQHYNDILNYYKHLNHNDENRRKLYFKRHSKTDNKNDAIKKELLQSKGKITPKILSHIYLW